MDEILTRLTCEHHKLDGIVLDEDIGSHGTQHLHTILRNQLFKEDKDRMKIERYLSKLDNNGKAKIKYVRPKRYGRVCPEHGIGLQTLSRYIRHTIARENYIDIDMKNSAPMILLNVCKILDIPHKNLERFVNEKDQLIEAVMVRHRVNKDTAKELFLRLLHRGSYTKWIKDNSIVSTTEVPTIHFPKVFSTECGKIIKRLMELNPELVQWVQQEIVHKDKPNIPGTFISYYLNEIESRILEQTYLYLNENNVVLCNDGIMIMKRDDCNELLINLNQHIYNSTGMRIEFINKQMNEFLDISVKSNPNEPNTLETPEITETHGLKLYQEEFTTGLLSDHFEQTYDTWICVNGKGYCFRTFRWYEDTEEHSLLYNFLDSIFIQDLQKYSANCRTKILNSSSYNQDEINKLNLFDKNINKVRNIGFRKSLVKDVLNKIRNDTIEFDANPYIFCFNNCYYNIEKKAFYMKAKPGMYLRTTCGYDYDFDYDEDRIQELHDLLDTIFNEEVKEYYLSILKTGLVGKLYEHLFIATGRGGNGKSLLNSLMLKTVGNYGYILPSEFLLKSIPTGANPQIANLHKKRFVLSSEPDREKKMTASTIKDLTGNSEFNARSLYSIDCKVVNNMTLILEANDLPKMSEVNEAIDRRVRIVRFSNLFVGKDKFDMIDEETRQTGVYQANEYYKTDKFKEKYKQALFDILREHLEEHGYDVGVVPRECEKFNKSYLQGSDHAYQFVKENFICVEDGVSYTYLSEIYDVFVETSFYRNMSREQKKEMSRKTFIGEISNNLFLRKYFKGRDKRFNGKQLTKPALINWRRKTEMEMIE